MSKIMVLTNNDGRGAYEDYKDAEAFFESGALFVRDESTGELIEAFSPMGWFRAEKIE